MSLLAGREEAANAEAEAFASQVRGRRRGAGERDGGREVRGRVTGKLVSHQMTLVVDKWTYTA